MLYFANRYTFSLILRLFVTRLAIYVCILWSQLKFHYRITNLSCILLPNDVGPCDDGPEGRLFGGGTGGNGGCRESRFFRKLFWEGFLCAF